MSISELITKSAVEQRKALLNKEVSAVELVEETYKRVDELDGEIGAYNSLTREYAIENGCPVICAGSLYAYAELIKSF